MTNPDSLEHYYNDFGARLSEATRTATDARRPRRRRRLAAMTVLAVGAIAVTTLALGASTEQLDPVAEAQAALATPGDIIYMKITSTYEGDADGVPPPQTTEQWSTLDPLRWRLVQELPQSPGGTVGDAAGAIAGRTENAYADGELRYYIAKRDTLTVRRGYNDASPAVRLPSLLPTGGGEVQTDLRAMLGDDPTDEGEQQAGGRTVRRLVSVRRPANDSAAHWRFVYDVDPDTYEPIGGVVTITFPNSRGKSHVLTIRIHIDEYRRLSLNASTARLLEITTTPRTKVTIETAQESRNRGGASEQPNHR